MNYRSIIRILVLVVSILSVTLITSRIDTFVQSYKTQFNPFVFTWMGMGIIVLIYYPLFTQIDKFATKYSTSLIKAGNKLTGNKAGVFVAFLLIIAILYLFYGYFWFDKNVYVEMFRAIVK